MIAVYDFDIHTRLCHSARDLAELPGFRLVEFLHKDVSFFKDADAGRFECFASSASVYEEKVGDADAIDDEGAATFDADSSSSQRLAHLGQRARAVLQRDG